VQQGVISIFYGLHFTAAIVKTDGIVKKLIETYHMNNYFSHLTIEGSP